MLLMIGKGISAGICHAIHRYAKENNKYLMHYDENKELSYILYLDAKIFMDEPCLKNCL